MTLEELGWDGFFEANFGSWQGKGMVPARVVAEAGPGFEVECEHGPLLCESSGRLRHTARSRGELPSVGDWIAVQALVEERRGVIHGVLPRKTRFSRKEAGGRSEEQVLVANVDTVFVVCGLGGYRGFSVRKVERYIVLGRSSGATPVLLLNKIDLCPEYEEHVNEALAVAPDLPVHPVSATERRGLDALAGYLKPGSTAVFLGPSGVGKSALVNALSGREEQDTGVVREADGKGRHTTTRRQLVILPGGGLVIDTPGLRELAMSSDADGLGSTFEDVESFFAKCRFRDCRHQHEPGCAVREALEKGELDPGRWESYRKLLREEAFQRRRREQKGRLNTKRHTKWISQFARALKKEKYSP